MTIHFEPIGTIHTPFKKGTAVPIQPRYGRGVEGTVEVRPEFAEGLADLDGFSHLILLYHFHLAGPYQLKVRPYLDTELRGVFATRAPRRPNGVGLSVVRLLGVDGSILKVCDLDIVDGTPLLDIKPYMPSFEPSDELRIGWLAGKKDSVEDRSRSHTHRP